MTLKLAARLGAVKPSAVFAMAAEAAALRAQGRDVIDLSAGEPDFDTPEHVKAAAREALARGLTKYTPIGGTDVLKDAVVVKLQRDNGLAYGRTEIMASCGGKHSLFNAFQALFDPGDEVVLPAPYWVSYFDMLVLAGAVPRVVETSVASGFKMSPAQFEAAIGPRTVAVIVNSPSNPTGAAYDAEELRALGRVALQRRLLVISDDIYERLTARPVPHLGTLVPELRPRLVIVNSVSKSYAMTGWRIGYTAGPPELIRAMTTLQSQSTSNPSSIAQAGAATALSGPQDCVVAMADEFERRRRPVVREQPRVAPREVGLDPVPQLGGPRGAIRYDRHPAALQNKLRQHKSLKPLAGDGKQCACGRTQPTIARVIGRIDDCIYTADGRRYSGMHFAFFGRRGPDGPVRTASEVATYLLRHAGVAAVPGEDFGAPAHVRFSYAASREILENGLARVARALAQLE